MPSTPRTCPFCEGTGVCRRCDNAAELTTRVGCSCDTNQECDIAQPGLTCFGEDFGGGPGFCWAVSGQGDDALPDWQCAEGTCGMAAWYLNANMYCEHYSTSGQARCEPWHSCTPITARVCAGQNLICDEFADVCPQGVCCNLAAGECCESECQEDDHCSTDFGWPFGYDCTPQLDCQP